MVEIQTGGEDGWWSVCHSRYCFCIKAGSEPLCSFSNRKGQSHGKLVNKRERERERQRERERERERERGEEREREGESARARANACMRLSM